MPTKSLNSLAWPLVISFTFRFMFTLVDLIYAAKIKDEAPYGVAAIGLFIPIQTLFIALWVGLSAGLTASISQAFGRRDQTRMRSLRGAMVKIHIALVPLLLGLGAAVYWITPSLELEPELARDFLAYSLILILSMPFSGFLSIYPDSVVKAHHDTVSTMKAGIYSTVTNVLLNTLFVFAFHWGIAGIALATVISRFAGLGYAMFRTGRLERARLAEGNWDQGSTDWVRGPLRDILALGLPGCLAYCLIFAEELTVTQLLLLQESSEVYIAAFAVYSRITGLAIMPAVATAVAVLPYVARLVAERQEELVQRNLRSSLFVTAGMVSVIAIPAGWIFARPLADFLVAESSADAGANAAWYLALIPVASLVMLPFLLLRPVFEAVGHPRLGVRITILKSVGFCIPLILGGYAISRGLDADPMVGILLGSICGWLLASTTTAIFCRRLLVRRGARVGELP